MASVEAQHLLALSLGKIAASRATRSGINLHKSLLVSSVLYKAKTAILMNKYRASLTEESQTEVSSCDTEESDISSEDPLQCREASAPAEGEMSEMESGDEADYYNNEEENVDSEHETVEDKENVNPRDLQSENQVVSTCQQGSMDNIVSSTTSPVVLGSSENTSQTQDSNHKEITKCERCTKRRLSSVDSGTDGSIPAKRGKHDENTPSLDNHQISQIEADQSQEQPMEQTQITHLVDSFSSGFGGLLNTTCGNSPVLTPHCQQVQTCATTTTSDYIGISPKSQGFSEAFSYCSSQIKESFDTLTSPIIALTV